MKKIITTIIGFLILGILLYSFGIEEITSILLKTNITYFILAAISFLFVEILSAIKLKLVSPLKFSQLFLSHMGGMFFSQITPARSGYFYTSYSLGKKENKNVSEKIGLITLVQAIMMISKILPYLFYIGKLSHQFCLLNHPQQLFHNHQNLFYSILST
ncbi:MAG: flippase-like domain-containing protein [Candidatus Aenigmarchaeota archaeon]|nr:flippase-like domain-containing protein [Candidatus Aenigmarchaeota archaeon]